MSASEQPGNIPLQPNIPTNIATRNMFGPYLKVILVIIVAALMIGGAFLLLKEMLIPANAVKLFGKENLVETKTLPISPATLTNKVFYEWRGGAKGRVIAKDNTTFTLERDGSTLKVLYEGQSLTQIWDLGEKKKVSLENLVIGSEMIGEVWISIGGKEEYVGGFFNVQKPSNQ